MFRFALVAAVAAVVAVPALITSTSSADAATKVRVAPVGSYVLGEPGAKWAGMCWKVGSGGVSTYQGYWAACGK